MSVSEPVATESIDVSRDVPAATGQRPNGDGKAMAMGFALTAVFDIGVALVAFQVAKQWGAADQVAYLASGIGPLTMMLITWIRARTLSGVSVIVLVILLLSSVAALVGGTDSRLLIVKDSAITAGFGLACLVSLLFPKPLMFYFGAKFATDGTRAGLNYWSSLWAYPDFRRSQYRINNVWGIAFLIEAALRVVVAYTVSSFQAANAISNILPWVFLAGLLTYTIGVGQRARAASVERIRAAGPAAVTEKTA